MYSHKTRLLDEVRTHMLRSVVEVSPPQSIPSYLRSLRRMLTPCETAKILGRHRETIYLLIAAGMPAKKQGGSWRIDPILLADWIEAQ